MTRLGSPNSAREHPKKTSTFRIILRISITALLLAGCTSLPTPEVASQVILVPEQFYVPDTQEQLYGSWMVTKTHLTTFVYPKMVIHSWGLVEFFESVSSTSYAWRGSSTIVQKWTDEAGNIWYKEFFRLSMKGFYAGHAYNLLRISADGRILESIFGNVGWPEPSEMDPESNTTYVQYQRLE
jgi:hypothetical protein